METFDAKHQEETVTLTMDFVNRLASGETISSATWDVSVVAGVDPSPNNMKTGALAISGSKISQRITGGVVGVKYRMKVQVGTNLTNALIEVAHFTVMPIP